MPPLTTHSPDMDSVGINSNAFMNQIIRISINDSRKLKKFIWRYEHNEENIEDIIQDAVIEALRSEHSFEYRSSIETWFFGVAANVARRHVARHTLQAKRITSLDADDDVLGHVAWQERQLDTDGPDIACQFNEFVQGLSAKINQFPTDLRRTFELVCFEGRSYQDVAAQMQIPIGTVRSRVNRARKLLQQSLETRATHGQGDPLESEDGADLSNDMSSQ